MHISYYFGIIMMIVKFGSQKIFCRAFHYSTKQYNSYINSFSSMKKKVTTIGKPVSMLTIRKRNNSSLGSTATTESSIQLDENKVVEDMLYRIRHVNNMPDEVKKTLLDFRVDGLKLGKVTSKTANMLCNINYGGPPVFEIQTSDKGDPTSTSSFLTLSSSAAGNTVESRTIAVAKIMEKLRDDGIVRGWRDETYPISSTFYDAPIFHCERAAVSLLGVLEYGVHVNGLVINEEDPEQTPLMWIGRRSKTKSKYPGMLDHIAAGGQPSGLSLTENVIKECGEEAGIPEDLAEAGLQSVGVISYETFNPKYEEISRCVLFNYDLYLPKDFIPKPVDGEVEEFFLWTVDEIKASMDKNYHDPIKPNCYVVIIDYMVRMGYVSPEAPDYLNVVRELRSGDCF